jgi:hypothetical protein
MKSILHDSSSIKYKLLKYFKKGHITQDVKEFRIDEGFQQKEPFLSYSSSLLTTTTTSLATTIHVQQKIGTKTVKKK